MYCHLLALLADIAFGRSFNKLKRLMAAENYTTSFSRTPALSTVEKSIDRRNLNVRRRLVDSMFSCFYGTMSRGISLLYGKFDVQKQMGEQIQLCSLIRCT